MVLDTTHGRLQQYINTSTMLHDISAFKSQCLAQQNDSVLCTTSCTRGGPVDSEYRERRSTSGIDPNNESRHEACDLVICCHVYRSAFRGIHMARTLGCGSSDMEGLHLCEYKSFCRRLEGASVSSDGSKRWTFVHGISCMLESGRRHCYRTRYHLVNAQSAVHSD